VGIGLGAIDGSLLRHIAAPDLAKSDEEALRGGIAVALAIDVARLGLGAFFGQRCLQCLEGDADAGVVSGVFTEGLVADEMDAGIGSNFKAIVLLGVAFTALLELGEIVRGEPDADIALGIKLRVVS